MHIKLPGTGKVQRIDKAEGGCTSGTTRCKVSHEPFPELGLLVNSLHEDVLVHILEGKVESLSGEVTDDIGKVTTPVGSNSLFLGDTDESIHNTYWKRVEIKLTFSFQGLIIW